MEIRCMGCMQMFEGSIRICPHCGYIVGTPAKNESHISPGTFIKNRFIIGKVLGFGGFGVTYIGWDSTLRHKIAIKEYFPAELSTRKSGETAVTAFSGSKGQAYLKGKNRFLEEARILAKLSRYSGIVNVHDFFKENNTAYIIMEYVEGITLKKYLSENGKIPVQDVFSLLMPVITTLKEIHKLGVVHRDISPENIMINTDGIKLLDFGAAKEIDINEEKSLSIVLKHGYAPEEQYRSKGRQGPWTDIYALCATVYKCVTGTVPSPAPDRMYEDTLLKPSQAGIIIDPKYERIIMKGLALRAENRYQSIDELILDIQNITDKSQPSDTVKKITDINLDATVILSEKEKNAMVKPDKNNKHHKFFIVIIVLFVLTIIWGALFGTDYFLAYKWKDPIFCVITKNYENGSVDFTGVFYKIQLHVDESGDISMLCLPWFKKGPNDNLKELTDKTFYEWDNDEEEETTTAASKADKQSEDYAYVYKEQ